MTIKETVKLIKLLETYPIDYVLAKQFILAGIKTEAELQALLIDEKTISSGKRWSIQNAYRDIAITKIVDINKIPVIP